MPASAVPQLLAQLWDDALDPGYAAAAASSSARSGSIDNSRSRSLWSVLTLTLVGLLLAVAIAQADLARPAVAQRRLDLIARIHTQSDRYDTRTIAAAQLQAEVDRLKSVALGATQTGRQLDADLSRLELSAAQLAVQGPGLRVTLDDAPSPAADSAGDPALGHVLDRDLQMVVNGLWAAGAEAVSVNGQRLTVLSAIRSAGDAILVDYRPLSRPYVVVAIGDPRTLEAAFSSGPAGSGLRTLQQAYGVRSVTSPAQRLTIPAAAAVPLRYARPEVTTP